MRYISQHNDLVLYDERGRSKYVFQNGQLELPANVEIDASDRSATTGYAKTNLAAIRVDANGIPVDALGNQLGSANFTANSGYSGNYKVGANRLQMCGMGYLQLGRSSAVTVPSGYSGLNGLKGIFFEAPSFKVSGSVSGSYFANTYYEVLAGDATYGGAKYQIGEMFKMGDTIVPATSSSSTSAIAMAIPPELSKTPYDGYKKEAFKIAKLEKGDEVLEITPNAPQGFVPQKETYTR